MTPRWKRSNADYVDLTLRNFSDHGADLCRPDIQPNDQRIFLPHRFITSFQTPQGTFLTTILFKSLQSIEAAENPLFRRSDQMRDNLLNFSPKSSHPILISTPSALVKQWIPKTSSIWISDISPRGGNFS